LLENVDGHVANVEGSAESADGDDYFYALVDVFSNHPADPQVLLCDCFCGLERIFVFHAEKFTTMNLVALYARVSKDMCRSCGKAEASHTADIDHDFKGQDPEAQLQPLREMCRMRGWKIVHEYIDQGWGGSRESRPAFDELTAIIAATDPRKPETRKFDGLVVWRFDRFFRGTKHMLQVLDTFNAKRLEFVSLTESIDTSTPIGRLLYTILAAIGEFELNLMAERIRNGMKKQGAKKPGPKVSERGPSRTTLWRRGRAG